MTLLKSKMGDKSVETLCSKIRFSSVLDTFSPFPPQTMLIFLFLQLQLHNIIKLGPGVSEN